MASSQFSNLSLAGPVRNVPMYRTQRSNDHSTGFTRFKQALARFRRSQILLFDSQLVGFAQCRTRSARGARSQYVLGYFTEVIARHLGSSFRALALQRSNNRRGLNITKARSQRRQLTQWDTQVVCNGLDSRVLGQIQIGERFACSLSFFKRRATTHSDGTQKTCSREDRSTFTCQHSGSNRPAVFTDAMKQRLEDIGLCFAQQSFLGNLRFGQRTVGLFSRLSPVFTDCTSFLSKVFIACTMGDFARKLRALGNT